MICADLKPAKQLDAFRLKAEDVPNMLDLIAIAQPGPFLPGIIEMGHYFSLRQERLLVAMAGERLHLTGFCEISAVCTHPDYRRCGYCSGPTTKVAEMILARGEIPFLHLALTNEVARKIYEKLGYRLRKEIQLNMLKKTGLGPSQTFSVTASRTA